MSLLIPRRRCREAAGIFPAREGGILPREKGSSEAGVDVRACRPGKRAGSKLAALASRMTAAACALSVALVGLSDIRQCAAAPATSRGRVVVYTSQDQVYSEPILKEFERRTGIKTAVVYDSEAVKTVGLANRLLAERSHPQCDVFWSNEELRTRQLAAENVFRKEKPWAAIGYRSRRMVVNTNSLSLASAPASLRDLTNRVWNGKIALAYPLFGTTATHFMALRQRWGAEAWENWCRALAANKPFLVDGNSVVAKLVARGEAWIGLTDSDDIAAEQRAGGPLAMLPLTREMLLIPNTVAVIRQAPHPEAAQKLWEYLQTPPVTQKLVAANALEGATARNLALTTLPPDWNKVLADMKPATEHLKAIFLR